MWKSASAWIGKLVAVPIWGYRYALSPLLGVNCRFAPSCSEYAARALARHGAIRGGWLSIRRLLRCHPWGGHGFDPVPADRCRGQRP